MVLLLGGIRTHGCGAAGVSVAWRAGWGLAWPLPFRVLPSLLMWMKVSAVGLWHGCACAAEFKHLKWYQDMLLPALPLNVCSVANKGIKPSFFRVHSLEIKGNNWWYTNTEIFILHRLKDPCCRSWEEPVVREQGGQHEICLAPSSTFCAVSRGKLIVSCAIPVGTAGCLLLGQDKWGDRVVRQTRSSS